MAAVVVKPDTIAQIGATGLRKLGTHDSVTVNDRFHIGSNTKAMTATVIAELVKENKLSWNTTPLQVFPKFANSINPAFRSITLEELLSHRAGIPPYTKGSEFEKLPNFKGTPTEKRKQFTKYLLSHKPANKPGTEFLYSNAGYSIAAAMAEQTTGKSWKTLMRQKLFKPLHLDGGFGWPAANGADQPWGHWIVSGDTLQPQNPDGSYHVGVLIAPAGDVNISVGNYGKFLQWNLRGLLGMKTKILTSREIKNLHKSRGPMYDIPNSSGYALGWARAQFLGVLTSLHAGSAGTFYVRAAIQPSRKIAVAVFANADSKPTEETVDKTLKVLIKKYGKEIHQ